MHEPAGSSPVGRAWLRRVRRLGALAAAVGYIVASLWGRSPAAAPVYAQGPNQVGLVIYHGDGRVTTRCVQFGESQLSGYDVLARSGLDLGVEASGMGASICRIDGTGCNVPAQSCFCGMENGGSSYWSYWQLRGGQWTYSNMGASGSVVQSGMVEGWRWGPGNVAGATPPPPIQFEEICQVATATPTATSTLPATPTLPPTATDAPTPTPTETETPAPTLTPTATPWPSATPTFVPATATPTWTPSPIWTPTATWTPSPSPSPSVTPDPAQAAASVPPTWTPLPTPVPLPVLPQATGTPVYAARLPLVHGQVAEPLAALPVAAVAAAAPATEVPTPEPAAPLSTAESAPAAAAPLPPANSLPPTPVVIVVTATPTPAPVAAAPAAQPPTQLPAATPVPSVDPQLATRLGLLAVGGIVLLAPFGLVLVVLVGYAIARRL